MIALPSCRRPRLGFLGLGWIGRLRMEAIVAADVAEVAALADVLPENLDASAKVAPQAARVERLEELFGLGLDGVVIATPSAMHAEQTTAALSRGLAVFCQKPLGRSEAEVAGIIAVAREANRLLGIDLSYRHLQGMQKIRELVTKGELGRIFAADLVFHNAYGPQKPWFYDRALSGGGCVVDLGIHLVDAVLWILQSPVIEVSSEVFAKGVRLSRDSLSVEDYATARLRLENGAIVNLDCSWNLHAGRPAVIEAAFYGTSGGAALRNVSGSFLDFQAEHFRGTECEILAAPPDDWGGRAVVAWARELSIDAYYQPEIERQVEVARVLDAIYGRPFPPVSLNMSVS